MCGIQLSITTVSNCYRCLNNAYVKEISSVSIKQHPSATAMCMMQENNTAADKTRHR